MGEAELMAEGRGHRAQSSGHSESIKPHVGGLGVLDWSRNWGFTISSLFIDFKEYNDEKNV